MSGELKIEPRLEPRLEPQRQFSEHNPGSSQDLYLRTDYAKHHSGKPVDMLAYVHLRNIHASTGAGRVARQIIEHLALRKDVKLEVLADQSDRERILPLVGEPWRSFRYATFAADTSKQQARWFAFDKPKAESFCPQAEIVYCTGESYVPTKKARLVVTAHDAAYFEPGAHRRGGAFWRQQIKWKLLFHKLSKHADMIHTVSHFSAERLGHFFPQLSSRIRVVPNGVTANFFGPLPESGLQFLRQNGLLDHRIVLVPGGLHFRKNAELILAVVPSLLAKFSDLLLIVAGHSDPRYTDQADSIGRRVRLLGFVDDAVLHALYAKSSVVWFPSLYEGFGLPILEAMAAGAPVVASNTSSLPEVAGDAALLAGARDPDQHLECISTLLDDESLSDRMREFGRRHASNFTWQNSAAQLKHHFDQLL